MEIIKEEYKEEYEKRTSEIKNIILNAYSDYYNLIYIEPYLEKFQPRNADERTTFLPARVFINSIIRTFQAELILITWALEDDDKASNSLIQLKSKLHKYLVDFNSCRKQLLKMPEKDESDIKKARCEAIAHFQFNTDCNNVSIEKVKSRLDVFKDCFNSYLFGDAVKNKIDENLMEKNEKQSQLGVCQLFSGFVGAICSR